MHFTPYSWHPQAGMRETSVQEKVVEIWGRSNEDLYHLVQPGSTTTKLNLLMSANL